MAMHLNVTLEKERAILVGVVQKSATGDGRRKVDEYLGELKLLAQSAGAEVVMQVVQERRTFDPAFYIGSGKADDLAALVEEHKIQLIVFDDDLSPVQIRNLERVIKCKIIDRSGMILDIFASRARTSEAKTQVELAQLQYMLPRLTRQWTHLSKQFGGIGTKGPGETQIETDRRAIRTKIVHLNTKLDRIEKERKIQRKGREQYPRVALVGYTNAGKSTLMNRLANEDVLVEDKLFATLDSTVRSVVFSSAHKILLSDTVGFIRKLPHNLVASFKSTLAEVREADILLHVVDISHPLFEEQIEVVDQTLLEIEAQGKPTVYVFNKIDRVEDRSIAAYLAKRYENSVFLSASRGINLGSLEEKIIALLETNTMTQTITFNQSEYGLISQIHDLAEILETHYDDEVITLTFKVNRVHAEQLQKVIGAKRAS